MRVCLFVIVLTVLALLFIALSMQKVKTVNVSRLLLCDATARVMERAFALLGIRTVEKM